MNLIDLHNSVLDLKPKILELVLRDSGATSSEIGKDIKMNLDYELHVFLSNALAELLDITVVSEESEQKVTLPVSHWLIDPLDGSLNYSRRIENYFTSIALSIDGEYKIGVLFNLNSGDVLSSITNTGVFLNGKAINSPPPRKISDCIVATGIPTYLNGKVNYSNFWSSIIDLESRVKKLRMFGSAASSLFMLALGKVDVYYEVNIAIWDVRAGMLICEELGMEISVDWNNELGTVLVSNSVESISI